MIVKKIISVGLLSALSLSLMKTVTAGEPGSSDTVKTFLMSNVTAKDGESMPKEIHDYIAQLAFEECEHDFLVKQQTNKKDKYYHALDKKIPTIKYIDYYMLNTDEKNILHKVLEASTFDNNPLFRKTDKNHDHNTPKKHLSEKEYNNAMNTLPLDLRSKLQSLEVSVKTLSLQSFFNKNDKQSIIDAGAIGGLAGGALYCLSHQLLSSNKLNKINPVLFVLSLGTGAVVASSSQLLNVVHTNYEKPKKDEQIVKKRLITDTEGLTLTQKIFSQEKIAKDSFARLINIE
ncbi:MAG TPA: hypothetical protein VLB80_03920 [Candidatus Babeliales bacterium]|nr:hypothetical protein [Candidatus Babeliales bacterium]